jgi:hypothetical protein
VSKSNAVWAAVVAACCAVAFLTLDPIIAAFVAILLGTGLLAAVLARDWDRHSTYEQREQARAQRRKEKWERGKDVRERDRVRWEAHQARQAEKTTPREPGQ